LGRCVTGSYFTFRALRFDYHNSRAKAWTAHHFVMRVLKNGNRNTKILAYTSLVRPVLEYRSACWDPCREGNIDALDRAQQQAAQVTHHTKDSDWETLA